MQRFQSTSDYPPPGISNFATPNPASTDYSSIIAESAPSTLPHTRSRSDSSPFKRRYTNSGRISQRSHTAESPATMDACSPQTGPPTPYSSCVTATPLSPKLTVGPEDSILRFRIHEANQYPPIGLRRMSVQSLLEPCNSSFQDNRPAGRQYPRGNAEYTVYGYDCGLHDLDTPKNDDFSAIAIFSPTLIPAGLNRQCCRWVRGWTTSRPSRSPPIRQRRSARGAG